LVSTVVETENPEQELNYGLGLLGQIDEKFFSVSDIQAPVEDGSKDHVYISRSFDAETHFNWDAEDILSIYKRITGKDLDLTPPKKEEGKEEN
jgi:Rab GDP dissociation inhibitor